ncbi:cytochrome C [Bordetella genomosp. 5]|uniref:Cytochrome C n=1 Tax=Bordetella genomosp. 5 TaxID=1395608 RepID=A0A261TEJ7_9BORD|nr:cytochrome c [Bordetella genomosp. 5]OZI41403.1 cytochrome C [Bordetella genomosp. 5]OZI48064.1 cytochrome C [Bordetella genomosp. 5]
MKKLSAIAALVCTSLAPLMIAPAHAQFAKAEDAVKYREASFKLIASHFGRMQPVVRGQAPYDAAQIKANVDVLKTLATLPWAAFGPGTEGGDAKPEIWSNADDFKAKQQRLIDNVNKLSVAADAGDLDKVRAAFGDVGASCKACHDAYRKK